MTVGGELLVAAVIALGLVGTVVPMLPGASLVAVAVVGWAVVAGGWAWSVAAVAVTLIVGAAVGKYLVAGSGLKRAGIGNRTIVIGGLVGIVGFFVIPVVGLPLGFLVGAAASEWVRTRDAGAAWRGALAAARAAVITIGIELTASLIAAAAWLTGAIVL